MDVSCSALLDLPLEMLTCVCQQLDLYALIRTAETCQRLRHGDGGLETAELQAKSPLATALRELAFPGGVLIPGARPVRFESWVAYLARCARQRRCRDTPPIALGDRHSLLLDAPGRLQACGGGSAVGHGNEESYHYLTPVAAMTDVRVRSVAAGYYHSLALSWDGRVYSWGSDACGQLGLRDQRDRHVPTIVEGLQGVRGIGAAWTHSLALTRSGEVFSWGSALQPGAEDTPRPVIVEGFGENVRVRRVFSGLNVAYAIGEAGELFSWSFGDPGTLGHGDEQDQPSPKRVEALRGVRVSSVSAAVAHALALAEDGLVYSWSRCAYGAYLGNRNLEFALLPLPVEALRGVRVCSVAAGRCRSFAATDTGELWAWGCDSVTEPLLGHGELVDCRVLKPIASLQGVRVDAVAAGCNHALALTDDGSVYACGVAHTAESGALGLGPLMGAAGRGVPTLQPVPAPT
jgi:alpha-tubulin suppressor-like RCC1 family protein